MGYSLEINMIPIGGFDSDQERCWKTVRWGMKYYYSIDTWLNCNIDVKQLDVKANVIVIKWNKKYSEYPIN